MIKIDNSGVYFSGSNRQFKLFIRNILCMDLYLKDFLKMKFKSR